MQNSAWMGTPLGWLNCIISFGGVRVCLYLDRSVQRFSTKMGGAFDMIRLFSLLFFLSLFSSFFFLFVGVGEGGGCPQIFIQASLDYDHL